MVPDFKVLTICEEFIKIVSEASFWRRIIKNLELFVWVIRKLTWYASQCLSRHHLLEIP